MRRQPSSLVVLIWSIFTVTSPCAVLLVDVNGANPTPPYADWTSAATNIQDAVDAAVDGDLILVTNGVYATGGTVTTTSLTNRVAVMKAVTVQSVNGPSVTTIAGNQVPGTIVGDSAVRCVYLGAGAALVGFTLANGATRDDGGTGPFTALNGGGLYCESGATASNCVIVGSSAKVWGGGVYGGGLNHCLVLSNTLARLGGGAYQAQLTNCTLRGNQSLFGGGAYLGRLDNCELTGNSASSSGGGAEAATLNGCSLTANSAVTNGGAAISCTLNNCNLTGNSAAAGGGAYSCTLNNCIVYYNSAPTGANYTNGTLNFCCTTPAPSGGTGNITSEPQLADFSHLSADSSCRGAGSSAYASGVDIDGEPWAVPPSIGCDEYYAGAITGDLAVAISPSPTNVAAGYSLDFVAQINGHASLSFWDFGDGTFMSNRPYSSHAWQNAGDYALKSWAFNETTVTGALTTITMHVSAHPIHYVALGNSNPVLPYLSWTTAASNIQDAVDAAYPGGLVLVSNGIYQTGGRVAYGAMTNRLSLNRPLTVQSVNGPQVTSIVGYQVPISTNGDSAVRCVYLTNGAMLVGFTLSGGATRRTGDITREQLGGGAWCASITSVVSNCVLLSNSGYNGAGGAYGGTFNNCQFRLNTVQLGSRNGGGVYLSSLNNCLVVSNRADTGAGAYNPTASNCVFVGNSGTLGGAAFGGTLISSTLMANSAASGAGAYGSTLVNCLIISNSASSSAGGAYMGALTNCTIVGNSSAQGGGGTYLAMLDNCIVYFNTATSGTNYVGTTMSYCCTTPLPSVGTGNTTNAPLFIGPASGNLRLQTNSPCIDAGNVIYVAGATDLDGRPRVVGGSVDMGAYEFQGPGSGEFIAWLRQYGLPADGSADFADPDGDGMNNWQEWRCGTDPTNTLSALKMLAPSNSSSGVNVVWQSVPNRTYYLQHSTNLSAQPAFSSFQSNISGQTGTTAYPDTNATGPWPLFYRVGIQ